MTLLKLLKHLTDVFNKNGFFIHSSAPRKEFRGLTTLAKVVTSRFVPQSAALRDPIVTAEAGQLRFKAFSSCNDMYARLALGSAALDGEFVQSGTTNVDSNEPMVNALSRIGRAEPVHLSVS